MIDPVFFYATYGPGMGFELALGNDGDFAYTLSGNMGALFPLHRLGHWQGHDLERVTKLRQRALSLTQETPSNAPPMPDSAFIAVRNESETGIVAGEYALYEPPTAIAPMIQDTMDLVHGDWLQDAFATLCADCQLVSGRPRITADVTLHALGKMPIQLVNPLSPDVFSMMLIDKVGEEILEPEGYELRIRTLSDINTEALTMELAPGENLKLTIEIQIDLPAGDWDLITTMELGSVPITAGKLAAGRLTWGPTGVVLPTS